MKKRTTIQSWVLASLFVLGVTIASWTWGSDDIGINNGLQALMVVGGYGMAVSCTIGWLCVAWEYKQSCPLHARIMYVNRWSGFKHEYETVYFLEWQYETEVWFMGFLRKRALQWEEANYAEDQGFQTADIAKSAFWNRIKELKRKSPVKDIQIIEVLVVQDAINKCEI